jgi:regulator of sigma E protease
VEAAADPDAKPVYKIGIERYGGLEVTAVRGAAAAAGLKVGDRLVAAIGGGTRVPLGSQSDLRRLLFGGPVEALEIQRGIETRNVSMDAPTPAARLAFLDDIGLSPPTGTRVQPLVVGALTPGPDGRVYRYPSVPSLAAGLRAGDEIVAIGEKAIEDWTDILATVGAIERPDPVTVTVRSADEETRELRIDPVALQALSQPELSGALPREPIEAGGVFSAMGMAVTTTGREVANVFRLIGALITGNVNFQKNIAGPITIVGVSSDAVKTSWLTFLTFLAYISVTLAVLNILPIPVLDGGHLVFLLMEKIKGSPLKEETMGKIQLVGFALLLVLMFFAFSNDIKFIFRS